jgi:alpha-amylase/alpha-mannosidase (GH57 family)
MIHLALLWHQHQPLYKDTVHPTPEGSYQEPWVRLHALRDYYSMAALVAEHPGIHLTINLTPALLWQIEDYTARGATDRTLEWARTPVASLTPDQKDKILATFFDADWHHQIFPHPRYKELFEQRSEGRPFSDQDLRDLQMWFNLAWFGREFHEGRVELVTGDAASVQRFAQQGRGFTRDDIQAMIEEQYKVMRAVIPLHRALQDRGQIEVSTTPFYHPILPLLIDTDKATIDRPGTSLPKQFAFPEDAEAQVARAVEHYRRWFGRAPRGMWPAEGAVSQAAVPFFAEHGISWIATDQGVLARSGRWGYEVDKPNVLCRPYRAEEKEHAVSVFFRDTFLSDAIGFDYHGFSDYEEAARDFVHRMKAHCARHESDDQMHTVVLDGENAWGAYREDARPFLHALYRQLEENAEIRTVTFSEYLEGNADRGIPPHPLSQLEKVYDLFTGSWIDEMGSAPGVDLGTWIGEPEENRAWDLLRAAREVLVQAEATPTNHPDAFEALYRAEGSDWFWWFGEDQDSGNDATFDDLFRMHLKNVYRELDLDPPAALDRPIVPRDVIWTFTDPVEHVPPRNCLIIQTNCPGKLTWWLDDEARTEALSPVGGVMAGVRRYRLTLGPFEEDGGLLHFRFRCAHRDCDGQGLCCREDEHIVQIGE